MLAGEDFRGVKSFILQVFSVSHPNLASFIILPKCCKQAEGVLTHTHWQQCRGFVLILSSTGGYSRTRERCSSVCVFARCLGARRVFWDTSLLGYIMASCIVMEKWTAANTICSDAAA